MLIILIRTRSPRFTSSGVVAGPALPFIVSQLNSMAIVLGIVLLGRMAHSWSTMPKSRSTRGACARRGWMMKDPISPIISCIGMCEW